MCMSALVDIAQRRKVVELFDEALTNRELKIELK